METMEKLIRIFVSSFILLVFISCIKKNNVGIIDNKSKFNDENTIIDSCINEFILNDTVYITKNYKNVANNIIDDFDKGECVFFFNQKKDENLIMKRSYGGRINEFSYFYVEKNKKEKKRAIYLKDQNFKSNKGAFIGQNLSDFNEKYKKVNFKVRSIADTVFYEFEKENDIYKSKYTFLNNILHKYEFGYQE